MLRFEFACATGFLSNVYVASRASGAAELTTQASFQARL